MLTVSRFEISPLKYLEGETSYKGSQVNIKAINS